MRVLFLSRWFPYPADNGSKLRISNLIRQLAVEHEMTLVSFRSPDQPVTADAEHAALQDCSAVYSTPYPGFDPSSVGALIGLFDSRPRSLVASHSLEFAAIAERVAHEHHYDLVIASELDMLPYALALNTAPVILDDLEVAVYRDGLARTRPLAGRLRARLTWFKLGAYLRRTLPGVAACTVVSELERENIRAIAPAYDRVITIPNAVDVASYADVRAEPQPNTLIFSGSLSYRVNHDGLRWFLGEVFPRIQRDVADVYLRVTGSTDSIDLKTLPATDAIEYTGYVDDVRPLIASSWVSIVPLWHGSGTRLKILEAMALGTPVISTTKGAEGLAVTPDVDIIIKDDPEGFARGVIETLQLRERRNALVSAGRLLVKSRYDWRVVGADIRALASVSAGVEEGDHGIGSVRWQAAGHHG